MIRSKLGLLGLCAVVFGVMAFSAGTAQAEVGAKWLILTSGGVVKTGSELPALLEGEIENKTASLLSKVLGISFQILCTAETTVGVKLEGEGSITSGGKVKYTGCSVILNGKAAPECVAHSAGSPVGTIETLAFKGSLILAEGSTLVLIEPLVGETFATINMGAECAVGKTSRFEEKSTSKIAKARSKNTWLNTYSKKAPKSLMSGS